MGGGVSALNSVYENGNTQFTANSYYYYVLVDNNGLDGDVTPSPTPSAGNNTSEAGETDNSSGGSSNIAASGNSGAPRTGDNGNLWVRLIAEIVLTIFFLLIATNRRKT